MNALGMPEIHKGLQARFVNHLFDSEQAQEQLGWTDEERILVERHLLGHRDLDRYNGFHLDDLVEGKAAAKLIDMPAAATSMRCIAFFRNEDGEVEQCPREAQVGDFCRAHAEEKSDSDDEKATEEATV
jgi:hypothetical protein